MTRLRAFFVRDVRLALAYPQGVVLPLVSIVFTVTGFAYLSRLIDPHVQLASAREPLDYFSYVVVNFGFMLLLNGALQAVSNAVRRDQVAGTLEAIIATPTSIPTIVLASALWPLAYSALQAAVYIGTGMIFGARIHSFNVAAFLAVLVASMACMVALGALGGAAVIRFKQSPPSSFLTGSAVAMLSGTLFPISLMPPLLRAVSWLLPLTHALNGLRGALSGASIPAVGGEILWLTAATALLAPLALAAFFQALHLAKRDGTLAAY